MNSPALSCSLVLQSRFWQRRSGAKMLRVEGSARCGGVPQGSGACQGQGNRKGRRGGRSLLAGPRRARGKHHPSADEPSRRPPTRRDPYAAHHRDARRAGSGLHLAVFCEPHFTWAAAAETLPQHSAQTTHAWRQNGLRPLATKTKAAVAPEARFSRAARVGTQRPQVLRGL